MTDQRLADSLTKAFVVLIGAPVAILTLVYLFSVPVWLLLQALGYDANAHPVITVAVWVLIGVFALAASVAGLRLMWPKNERPA